MKPEQKAERRLREIAWQQQKLENRRNNEALFTGRMGGIWRRGIMARMLFKGINGSRNS